MNKAMYTHERVNRAAVPEKGGDLSLAEIEQGVAMGGGGNNRDSLVGRGSMYARMERYEEALDCFNRARALGEDYLVCFNIGSVYYRMGQYKKSILALDTARKMRGDYPAVSLLMGLGFSRLGNVKAAETCFRAVLNHDPDNGIALTALSIMYYESGRNEAALEVINRLLSVNSRNGQIRSLKARLLYRMNRFFEYTGEVRTLRKESDSFTAYDRFIRSVPVEAFNDRFGTLNEKLDMLRAKTRKDGGVDSLMALSLCHLIKGDTEMAIEYLFEARRRSVN